MAIIHPTKYYCTVCHIHKSIYTHNISLYIAIYNNYTYSAGMKERCRDGCRTSLLIAGVFLVPAIFHTLLPPCHPYITIHFMEMIFSTCSITVVSGQKIACYFSTVRDAGVDQIFPDDHRCTFLAIFACTR